MLVQNLEENLQEEINIVNKGILEEGLLAAMIRTEGRMRRQQTMMQPVKDEGSGVV